MLDLLGYEFDDDIIDECCQHIEELDQEFARKIKNYVSCLAPAE